tara:strand:- start:46788 stop:47714 length:927 start_codon:yes stop_codon:yes gene_type:complete
MAPNIFNDIRYIEGSISDFETMASTQPLKYLIAGVQPKLLMALDSNKLIPCHVGEFIVKPTPEQFPALAENEYFVMTLAKAMGFETAEFTLLPFENGEEAYVTKRFDVESETNQKYFVEDGASLCNIQPAEKDDHDLTYERMINLMAGACENPEDIKLTCFKLVLFSYIVGNNDLHMKNFSFYRSPLKASHIMDGMTPIYDVVSIAPYPDYDSCYLSLSLLESEVEGDFSDSYEVYGYYTQHDFLLLSQGLELKTMNTASEILAWISEIPHQVNLICCNSSVLHAKILTLIKQRLVMLNKPSINTHKV